MRLVYSGWRLRRSCCWHWRRRACRQSTGAVMVMAALWLQASAPHYPCFGSCHTNRHSLRWPTARHSPPRQQTPAPAHPLCAPPAGKSALLHRLLTNCFRRRLPPTYGCEFGALRARLPNSSPTTAAATTDGGNCSSGGGGCGQSGSQRGAATSGSTAVVGVWDTGGSRFHALSRRFIQGSDAVLVCWDPASRVSWDAMRAWVSC